VLKPLCGDEPRLYENLRSFCEQDHPQFQIIFGTREADDAAVAIAQRLQQEFPARDIAVICDPRIHGINLKVSNLLNLLPHARYDWLVLADSDIAVQPDYLRRVTAPLAKASVGLVTCLYRGRPIGGLWSRLGAQFIDDWFRPSVALAQMFGAKRYGFGATLAFRRDTLALIGGLEAVSNVVADDYWLGELVANRGLETVLSDHEVVTDVTETKPDELCGRELRWFRTIRSVRPMSYLGTGVCFTLPMVFGALTLCEINSFSVVLGIIAIVSRLLLFLEAQSRTGSWRELPKNFAAFLLRDALSLALWAWAFSSAKVHWRGQQLSIDEHASARCSG